MNSSSSWRSCDAAGVDHRRRLRVDRVRQRRLLPGAQVSKRFMAILARYTDRVIGLAARHRLPAISQIPSFAERGGLLQYGADVYAMFRQSAGHVDRILKDLKAARGYQPVQVAENVPYENYAKVVVRLPELPGVQPSLFKESWVPTGTLPGPTPMAGLPDE